MKYTPVYRKTKKWYVGWVKEMSGGNTQGKTLKEVKKNLREALLLVMVKDINLHNRHPEIDWGTPQGKEIW